MLRPSSSATRPPGSTSPGRSGESAVRGMSSGQNSSGPCPVAPYQRTNRSTSRTWSGFITTTWSTSPKRSQTACSRGCGASGSSSNDTPPDRTANDATSGTQSLPSCQAGWGWRHSHRPSATSRTSTLLMGEPSGQPLTRRHRGSLQVSLRGYSWRGLYVGDVAEGAPDQREDEGGADEREPVRRGDAADAGEHAADRLPDEDAGEHGDGVHAADPALQFDRHRAHPDGGRQRPPHEDLRAEDDHDRH